jgi:Domain of unknown function (DUF5668)
MTTSVPGPVQPATPLPPPGLAQAGPRLPKNPWIALVLSFVFPGVGQLYNGQAAKALFFFFAFAGSIYAVVNVDPMPFALFIPFVIFYNLIDAWRSAELINARFLGGGALPEEETAESPAWGAVLVALGLLLLLNNLGWLPLGAVQRWWPVLMIAAGGAFLYGSLRRRQQRPLETRVDPLADDEQRAH